MTDSTPTTNAGPLPDIISRSPANSISVLVVGCGIGGLTAARECVRYGFSVRVFERQPQPVLTGRQIALRILYRQS